MQALTIALVVASGIAGFVGSLSTHDSLLEARDRYYASARFADVFSQARRAPDALALRLAELPGAAEVQTRLVFDTQIALEGVRPPLAARIVGADPFALEDGINRVTLRSGRWPARGSSEVLVNQAFASARKLGPGSTVRALLNGRMQTLQVVGVGLSPELHLRDHRRALSRTTVPSGYSGWTASAWRRPSTWTAPSAAWPSSCGRSIRRRRHRGARPAAGALRFARRLSAPRAGLRQGAGRRDRAAARLRSVPSLGLPGGGGVHPQRGAGPAGGHPARPDRSAQGAGLRGPQHRRPLPVDLGGDRRRRHRGRRGVGRLAGPLHDRHVHRVLPLPGVLLPARRVDRPAGGGRLPGRRRRRLLARGARRDIDARGRGDAPALAAGVPPAAARAHGPGQARKSGWADDPALGRAAPLPRAAHRARHRQRRGHPDRRHLVEGRDRPPARGAVQCGAARRRLPRLHRASRAGRRP